MLAWFIRDSEAVYKNCGCDGPQRSLTYSDICLIAMQSFPRMQEGGALHIFARLTPEYILSPNTNCMQASFYYSAKPYCRINPPAKMCSLKYWITVKNQVFLPKLLRMCKICCTFAANFNPKAVVIAT